MNTLVTGGGGFLGRYIVEQLLERGDAVTVFARGTYPELEQIGATLARGDLQDARAVAHACAGMDLVFHVAAQPGIWGAWESFYLPNVIGTQHVIAACKAQNVPKLVFTGSPSVVFDNQAHEGGDESLPYPARYENFYSHTKALAEQMIVQANSEKLLTVTLRPHLIWGPRDAHLLPPRDFHADTSRLVQILRDGHCGVVLNAEAWDRIITWIDLNAPFHGTWQEVVAANPEKLAAARHGAERRRALHHRHRQQRHRQRHPVSRRHGLWGRRRHRPYPRGNI